MGLQQTRSAPVNTRLCAESINTVSSFKTQKTQYQPHPHATPKYGQKQQLVQPENTKKKTTKLI